MSNSSTFKSHSFTVPCFSETFFNPRQLKNTVRPLSLDLSYHSEQTYSKTSTESILNTSSCTTNSLPLPPRRRKDRKYSLQGDEPPPRYLLPPKPARFKALSEDFKLPSNNQESKLPITPIIEITKPIEATDSEEANNNDDSFSLDDVFIENFICEAPVPAEDFVSALEDEPITFIDDAGPDTPDVENHTNNNGIVDSDVESQRSVPMERFDTDSQVDMLSESSVDTVATVIELRDRSKTLDSSDTLKKTIDNLYVIENPIYESLNKYEVLNTERKLSVIDESNPKLAKDLKNKMSKESTQRLSKNLAAEITDFFKSSASKLKPPCLDQVKKDYANKKLKLNRDISEPCYNKTPQRLIPRSPYITPIPVFEQKISPRKVPAAKQPPFYVWNINSKNAAVSTTLNPPVNYRTSANDESKALKDIENSTRKILELTKRSNGTNPTRLSPAKVCGRDAKSASTGQLAIKPPRDSKMSHSQSNDLKPKPRVSSVRTKMVPRPRPSHNRLQLPTTSPWDVSPSKALHRRSFKLISKNIPKINIPLPSPNITVTKVKTQLPCDFTTSTTCDNLAKQCTSTSQTNDLPNVVVEPVIKKSWLKKWRSVIQDLFRKHHMEFYINGVPPCYNCKRSNTWPPKNNPDLDDSVSIYMPYKSL